MGEMKMFDFSNERDQKDGVYGPVPAGSIVWCKFELQMPDASHQTNIDRHVRRADSGLLQLQFRCIVTEGDYEGVFWYENISLPSHAQQISLNDRQNTGCNIGGSKLKALLQTSGKSMRIQSYAEFDGLFAPVRVGINRRPYEKDGKSYWRNEIAKVITRDMKEYPAIMQDRQLINEDGAIAGKSSPDNGSGHAGPGGGSQHNYNSTYSGQNAQQIDEVPF